MIFAFLKLSPKFLNKWDIDGGDYNGYVSFDADLYPATGYDWYNVEYKYIKL